MCQACPSLLCSYSATIVKGWLTPTICPFLTCPRHQVSQAPSRRNSSCLLTGLLGLPLSFLSALGMNPWMLFTLRGTGPTRLRAHPGLTRLFLWVLSSIPTHGSPATPAPLLFLQRAQHTPTSGILNLPFLLSGRFFHRDPHSNSLNSSGFAQMASS